MEADRAAPPDELEAGYLEHGARVYRLALQILGQPADAEDAVQEVFLKVLDRAEQFEGRARFTTWLYRLTVNLCLHRLERERVRSTEPLAAEELPVATDEPSPLDHALALDEAERAAALLARLPLEHRLVLHMREVEGFSYREIAAALALPVGTVMSRIARARAGLARLVGPEEPSAARSAQLQRSLA